MESLKSLDFYPKLADDARVKTFTGAAVSLVAVALMTVLFISQFLTFLQTSVVDHLVVDTERGLDFQVNFDITFPHVPCDLLNLEVIDVASKQQMDQESSFQKQDIIGDSGLISEYRKFSLGESVSIYGNSGSASAYSPSSCGDCGLGSTTTCCNTCQDVLSAHNAARKVAPSFSLFPQCAREYLKELKSKLARADGCRFYGYYFTRRVAGQFKIVPGHHTKVAGAVKALEDDDVPIDRLDLSHKFNELRFGDSSELFVAPLRGVQATSQHPTSMFLYYTKVIPTSLQPYHGTSTHGNQYSVTEHTKLLDPAGLRAQSPGLFLAYEHSPIRVVKVETRQPFLSFLTQVCAIVGGVFALAGFIDKVLYTSVKHAATKLEIGKNY